MFVDVGIFDDEVVAGLHERAVSTQFLVHVIRVMIGIEYDHDASIADLLTHSCGYLVVDARSGYVSNTRVHGPFGFALDINRNHVAMLELIEKHREEERAAAAKGTRF